MDACLFRRFLLITSLFLLIVFSPEAFAQIDSWPGDEPAMFRAFDAYRAEDYERAAELIGQWLSAQPNDRLSWYSYACFLARTGQDSLAVLALQASLEAGGFPAEWSLQDPDLTTLHENERFMEIVNQMREIKQEEAHSPGGYRWLEQTRAGVYRLDLPDSYDSDNPALLPVVIYLHGGSGTLYEGRPVAERLTAEGFAVITIEASYRSNDGIGFVYWPGDHMDGGTMLNDRRLGATANRMNFAWYRQVLDDAARVANLDLDRVVLTGFSQGAFQTLYSIALDPEPFFAAAIIGGRVPADIVTPENYEAFVEKNGRFLILHGENDQIANPDDTEEVLLSAGINVTKIILPDTEHEVNEAVLDELAAWISGIVRQ